MPLGADVSSTGGKTAGAEFLEQIDELGFGPFKIVVMPELQWK